MCSPNSNHQSKMLYHKAHELFVKWIFRPHLTHKHVEDIGILVEASTIRSTLGELVCQVEALKQKGK